MLTTGTRLTYYLRSFYRALHVRSLICHQHQFFSEVVTWPGHSGRLVIHLSPGYLEAESFSPDQLNLFVLKCPALCEENESFLSCRYDMRMTKISRPATSPLWGTTRLTLGVPVVQSPPPLSPLRRRKV